MVAAVELRDEAAIAVAAAACVPREDVVVAHAVVRALGLRRPTAVHAGAQREPFFTHTYGVRTSLQKRGFASERASECRSQPASQPASAGTHLLDGGERVVEGAAASRAGVVRAHMFPCDDAPSGNEGGIRA